MLCGFLQFSTLQPNRQNAGLGEKIKELTFSTSFIFPSMVCDFALLLGPLTPRSHHWRQFKDLLCINLPDILASVWLTCIWKSRTLSSSTLLPPAYIKGFS